MKEQFEEYVLKILKERNIDIRKDDYRDNEKFLELNNEYVHNGKFFEPLSWWIEKNIVGEERLIKIYGKYALGVDAELTEKEMKLSSMYKAIMEEHPEIVAEDNLKMYFFRKGKETKEDEERKRLGLVYRLKEWGVDLCDKSFKNDKQGYLKLLFFLYNFESKKQINVIKMLMNPTLENVDNRLVGDVTRNGSLLGELKENIARAVSDEYIYMVKGTLSTIAQEWEKQIVKIRLYPDRRKSEENYNDLVRIEGYVKRLVDLLEQDFDYDLSGDKGIPKYQDSILETFYLKLCQHESLGREYDILDISNIELEVPMTDIEYKQEELEILENKMIDKSYIEEYITSKRRALAKLVFHKEKISGNDYKKFDKATSNVKNCIEMLDNNTKYCLCESVPSLLVVAIIKEILDMDKKEVIDNKFYHRTTADKKTLNTELVNGKDAFRKNQMAWVAKIIRRYNMCQRERKDIILARTIEKYIDKIMIRIYKCNSINDMIFLHNFIMIWIDAVFVPQERINKDKKIFCDRVFKECGLNVEIDQHMAQMFFGNAINSEIPNNLVDAIKIEIDRMKNMGEKNRSMMWPIEYQDNYFHGNEQYYLIANISLERKCFDVLRYKPNPKGKYKERLFLIL